MCVLPAFTLVAACPATFPFSRWKEMGGPCPGCWDCSRLSELVADSTISYLTPLNSLEQPKLPAHWDIGWASRRPCASCPQDSLWHLGGLGPSSH
jgi:hypothetical protein